MSAHRCHNCHQTIPHGMAVLRSRSFVLVALCRWCAGQSQRASALQQSIAYHDAQRPVTAESVDMRSAS